MKRLLILLAVGLLLAGCVAVPTPSVPESRGIVGTLTGDIYMPDSLTVGKDATVGGNATVTGDLTVSGTSTVSADPSALAVGGGFGGGAAGGSGCTITTEGMVLCDGKIYTRSTLGVTGAVTTSSTLDVGGTLNYGANDLYPVGYASSGKAIVTGQATTIAVGSVGVTHGLSTIDSVVVSLCQVPTAAAANANAVITSTTVTLEARDSTMSNRVNGVVICYTIIGTK